MDSYYTPEPLACDLLGQCSFAAGVARVVDPSCGGGALLSAAEVVLGSRSCVGIDLDRSTIRALRRAKPHWRLSVADLLCERSVRGSLVGRAGLVPDVLLLNPPFSQGTNKFVEFQSTCGEVFRVSRAMQFLLRATQLFRPVAGVFAIVPESLLFSELDFDGRRLIESEFAVREIAPLKSTAFKGARVRSIAVEFRRDAQEKLQASCHPPVATSLCLERGSLPVHLALPAKDGVPFVHSSDLLSVAERRFAGIRVERGRLSQKGWALLLPRVGLPRHAAAKISYFSHSVRLSDCVLALWFKDRRSAEFVEQAILDRWDEFIHLYRGTGARYVTVARLIRWLAGNGIATEML